MGFIFFVSSGRVSDLGVGMCWNRQGLWFKGVFAGLRGGHSMGNGQNTRNRFTLMDSGGLFSFLMYDTSEHNYKNTFRSACGRGRYTQGVQTHALHFEVFTVRFSLSDLVCVVESSLVFEIPTLP